MEIVVEDEGVATEMEAVAGIWNESETHCWWFRAEEKNGLGFQFEPLMIFPENYTLRILKNTRFISYFFH